MATERTIEERIQIVLLYAKFENFSEVQRQWTNHFNTPEPDRRTISNLVNKFKETDSVHDRERSGRPRSVVTEETKQSIKEMLQKDGNISIRDGARAMNMHPSSYYRAVEEEGFRSFRPTTVQELSDDDFDRRKKFCGTMLVKFDQNPGLVDKIIWSDESQFTLNGVINRHNCCYWAYSNPDIQIPVSNSKGGVMVWCGLTSAGLIGPYFFDGSVNAETYLQMLKDYVWPQVKGKRLYFQQDGASAHYATVVRQWLDQKFTDRWIGRRGPIEWPARSPDLTPPDFFLWGYLKDIVYRDRPSNYDQLRRKIQEACSEIDAEMCRRACQNVLVRFKRCFETDGKQIN